MEKKQLSTQPSTSMIEFHPKDTWVVVVNDKLHQLNGKEAEFLKRVTQTKAKGLVWFKTFAISIPHIQEIYRSESGKKVERYENKVEGMINDTKED